MVRSALVVIVLVIAAWLALGVRALALESSADEVLKRARSGPVPPTEVTAAIDDLAAAGRLSPDQGPAIAQGELLSATGHDDAARAVADRVTQAEPDNLQGWFLAWVVADPDEQAKARAKRRLSELNPWFAVALQRQRR